MRPPLPASWLIEAFAPAGEIAGDLEEEFSSIALQDPGRARSWYWRQTMRSMPWFLREALRTGQIHRALSGSLAGVLLPLLALDRLWAFVYSQIPLRDGLARSPLLLLVNAIVVCSLAAATACNVWTRILMPCAAALGLALSIAETGPFYNASIVGLICIAAISGELRRQRRI